MVSIAKTDSNSFFSSLTWTPKQTHNPTDAAVSHVSKGLIPVITNSTLIGLGIKNILIDSIYQYRMLKKRYLSKITEKTSKVTRKIFEQLKVATIDNGVRGALMLGAGVFGFLHHQAMGHSVACQPTWMNLCTGSFILAGFYQLHASLKQYWLVSELRSQTTDKLELQMLDRFRHSAILGIFNSLSYLALEAFAVLGLWAGYFYLFGALSAVTGLLKTAYDYMFVQPPTLDKLALKLVES